MALSCSKKEETIKIGVILPLSGEGATLGVDCENGIRLAVEDYNKDHEKKVRINYEDSQGNPETAVSAFNKLVAQGTSIIIGDLFSSPTLAMATLADKHKVLLLSPGASNPKLSNSSKYVFRDYPSDNFEGKLIAKNILGQGIKDVGIIFPNNDYGVGLKDVFAASFENIGGKILIAESYSDNTIDFRSLVVKALSKNLQALYLPGYYQSIGRIAVQVKQLGQKIPLFSNVGVEDPQLFTIAGNAVDGLRYTAPAVDLKSADKEVNSFVNQYKSVYGKDPGFPAAYGFDSANLLFSSIEQRGANPDSIRAALLSNQFEGVTGTAKFDSSGDVVKPFVIKVAKQGNFQILKKTEY